MMKAIVQETFGEPNVLKIGDVEIPQCNQNEVLIKVEATALNRADTLQVVQSVQFRKGKYPAPKGVSNIIGLECAGYLIDNPNTNLNKIDFSGSKRVMSLLSGGGYAQYCKVYKDHIIDIPDNLSFEQAAAIPEVWLTAYQLLHLVAQVQPGETVLILAAASGVGTSLIQLCKKHNVKSIAVASTQDKLKVCKDLGADFTISYKEIPEYSGKVKEFTNGKGANVILDPIMASNFSNSMSSLAFEGRWVIYGSMGGLTVTNANFASILMNRGQILTSTLRSRSDEYKKDLINKFKQDCLEDFKNGKLLPIVDKVFKLSEVVQAHKYMESNASIGKIILKNDLK